MTTPLVDCLPATGPSADLLVLAAIALLAITVGVILLAARRRRARGATALVALLAVGGIALTSVFGAQPARAAADDCLPAASEAAPGVPAETTPPPTEPTAPAPTCDLASPQTVELSASEVPAVGMDWTIELPADVAQRLAAADGTVESVSWTVTLRYIFRTMYQNTARPGDPMGTQEVTVTGSSTDYVVDLAAGTITLRAADGQDLFLAVDAAAGVEAERWTAEQIAADGRPDWATRWWVASFGEPMSVDIAGSIGYDQECRLDVAGSALRNIYISYPED